MRYAPHVSTFVRVGSRGDFAPGRGRTVTLQGRRIAVLREGDHFLAVADACPHMGASLADGRIEDGVVTCPWHGWRFRATDGTWADNPRVKIPCHQVRVVGDDVQIQLAGPAAERKP